MRKYGRFFTYFLILALAIAGAATFFGGPDSEPAPPAPVKPVTVPVSRGTVEKTVTAPGQLVGVQEAYLSFPIDGRLLALNVRPGSAVKAGQVIARLDDARLNEQLQRAEIRLAQAEAAHQQALAAGELSAANESARINSTQAQIPSLTAAQVRLEAAREAESRAQVEYQKALDRPWEPDQVRESYRLAYEAEIKARRIAEAEVEAIQRQQWSVIQQVAALETEAEQTDLSRAFLAAQGVDPLLALDVDAARRDLAAAVLTAPFDGVVLELPVKPGEQLQAGRPVALIGNPHHGEVRATVIEEDVPLTAVGQPAEIYFDARPELLLRGKIDRLVPQRIQGEERPLFAVYLALDEPLPDGVLPGMTADASIIIDRADNTLRLPRGVIQPRSDGTAEVRLWQNGGEVTRQVEVGLRGDAYIAITGGLVEGDEVIAE